MGVGAGVAEVGDVEEEKRCENGFQRKKKLFFFSVFYPACVFALTLMEYFTSPSHNFTALFAFYQVLISSLFLQLLWS